MRFREVSGYLKNVSPEETMIFIAVQKAFWVVFPVSSLEVAYLRPERL